MTDIIERLKDQILQLDRRSFDSVDAGLAANVAAAAIDEIEKLAKDLAEAVRLLDALLGLERGSGAAALLFVENHRSVGGTLS